MEKSIIVNSELPEDIINAYNDGQLVVFIGAGMSRLMGCSSWDELANKLLSDNFNFGQQNILKNSNMSSKEKITISYYKSKENNTLEAFYKKMKESFQPNCDVEDVYEKIVKLDCIFVTTNADGLLEKHIKPKNYSVKCEREILKNDPGKPFLFYLHGRLGNNEENDRKTLVFTVDEYLKKYNDEETISFLHYLFTFKTILFLGYGLNEFELLDHIVAKSTTETTQKKHYILEGFCSGTEVLVEAKRTYYESLGINLLTYNQDENGYQEQIYIIDKWISQLQKNSYYTSNIITELQSKLLHYSEDNYNRIHQILSKLDDKKIYLRESMKSLENSKDAYMYVKSLYDDGIISMEDCPSITDDGYAPYWDFTTCIERLIYKNNTDKNIQKFVSDISKEIIHIINSSPKIQDNFHLRMTITEIILMIDKTHIEDVHIDFIINQHKKTNMSVDVLGHVLYNNNHKWLKWKNEYVFKLLECILGFENKENRVASTMDSYDIENTFKKVIPLLSKSQTEYVYKLCVLNIYESIKDRKTYLFKDFSTQLLDSDLEYQKVLVDIIKKVIDKININAKNNPIFKTVKTANNTMTMQYALWLCKVAKCNIKSLNKFTTNPLSHYGTIADFYQFVELFEVIGDNAYVNKIIALINSATFGVYKEYELYEKAVNTHKLQLYGMLRSRNDLFNIEYEKHIKKDHFDITNPVEDAEKSFPHVFTFTPPKLFDNINMDKLTVKEMIDKIKESASNKYNGHFIYTENYEEILDYLFEKNRINELLELLNEEDTIDYPTTCSIVSTMSQSKYNKWNKSTLDNILKLFNQIYKFENSNEKDILIKNVIRILETFEEAHLNDEKLLLECLELDTSKLWTNTKCFENDSDILLKLLNSSEGMFYLLIFKTIVNLKENEKVFFKRFAGFKNYISKKIGENNIWMKYAIAFNYQNTYYLDSKWGDELFSQLFKGTSKNVAIFVTLACCGSNHLIKQLCKKAVSPKMLNNIFATNITTKNNKERVIGYLVAAYYYNLITQPEYERFVRVLENEIAKLFRAIVVKRDKNPTKSMCDVLILSYKILKDKITSENCDSIIFSLEQVENPTNEIWGILNDCFEKSQKHSISGADEKLFLKYINCVGDEYLTAFKTYLDKFYIWNIEPVKAILLELKKMNRNNDVTELGTILLNRGLFTDEIAKIIKGTNTEQD